MSDDRPVDASIRPVLPSRVATPPQSMWEEAGAVANERQAQDPQGFPLPPRPERRKRLKKPASATSPRSAIAKQAWETRRKNLKKSSALKHGGRLTPELYALIGALLELDVVTRKMVMKIVEAVS